MRELFIFARYVDARSAGFGGPGAVNPQMPEAMAWWLGGDPDALRGQQWARVTVSMAARDFAHRVGGNTLDDFNKGLDHAHMGLRLGDVIWIEI